MPANELCKKVGADCHIPALPHGNVHGKHIHRSASGLQCLPLVPSQPSKNLALSKRRQLDPLCTAKNPLKQTEIR